MYNKLYTFLIGMVIILSMMPLVSSAPPFQVSSSSTGLEVAGIDFSAIQTSTSRTAVANVFNASNGLPMTTASCQFQVFSVADTGALVFTNSTPTRIGNTYYFGIPNSVYNKTAEYTRIIQCNTSSNGGFYKSSFRANEHGEELTLSIALFYIFLLSILIIFLIISFFSFIYFDNLLNRVGMIGIGYLLVMATTFIAWNMATDFLSNAEFIVDMLRILFFVFVIGFFPLVIGGFAYYILMLFKIKEIERLMTKGFSLQDAERRVK